MTFDGRQVDAVWLIGALVLALAALSARRVSFWLIVKSLVSWAIIGAIAYLAVLHRGELMAIVSDLGERIGIEGQRVEGRTVKIDLSPDGHFWARVEINGVKRRMLIDSGATLTAISEQTARAAGIDTESSSFPMLISTANGTIAAQRATIERLTLGPLHTTGLSAVVAPNFGDYDVLGMNFLSRLKSWRVEGRTLILEPVG